MNSPKWIRESRFQICIIAALVLAICVFALITTAPAAEEELRFGEAVG